MRALATLSFCVVLTVSGCKEREFVPPDREEQVADAEALLTPETFDTIAWESDEARGLAGNVTFSAKCVSCHGPRGEAGTAYAAERDLDVPSLVGPEWRWGDSIHAVRQRIFTGHAAGMPTWGVAGITAREIDGAAYYIVEVLRPEMTSNP